MVNLKENVEAPCSLLLFGQYGSKETLSSLKTSILFYRKWLMIFKVYAPKFPNSAP